MKIFLIYSSFVIITIYVPPTLFPISYGFFGFPTPKHWYLPYPTEWVALDESIFVDFIISFVFLPIFPNSTPFDIRCVLGFYMILTLQCVSGMTYMLIVSLFSGFYIGMCSYIVTCISDLSTFVDELNGIVAAKNATIVSIQNQREIDDLCSNMLQFHIDVLK